MLTEASLSFLGLGDPDTVSWGLMIFEGQRQLRLAPWMSIYPGVALLLVVAAFNLLGDTLNAALNPRPEAGRRARPAARQSRRGAETVPTDASAAGSGGIDRRIMARPARWTAVSLLLRRGESLGIVGGKRLRQEHARRGVAADPAAHRGGPWPAPMRFRGQTGPAWTVPSCPMVAGRAAIDAHRWTGMSMVFQGAMHALNPVMTVRRQLREAYRLHHPRAHAGRGSQRGSSNYVRDGRLAGRTGWAPIRTNSAAACGSAR